MTTAIFTTIALLVLTSKAIKGINELCTTKDKEKAEHLVKCLNTVVISAQFVLWFVLASWLFSVGTIAATVISLIILSIFCVKADASKLPNFK